MGESAGQGEGLNLGLSIGGCFMKSVAKEEEEEKEDERSNGFRGTYCRNKGDAGECWELQRKKELQALRRQNARRKCDEKRAKREKGGDCEEESAPGLKEEEQKGSMIMTSGARRTDGGLPFVPMMQYVVQNGVQNGDKVQCIPVSVPYVFPCWPASSSSPRIRPALPSRDPMAVHGSGTVYHPIPCRSFAGDHRPGRQSSSAASSSSAVSENNNGGGSSSETRSHSQSEQCRQPTASSLSQSTSIDKTEVQSRTPSVRFVSAPSASKEMVAVDAGEEKQRVVIASAAPSNDEIIIPANDKEEIAPKGPNGAAASVSTGEQKAGVPASLSSMPCVATTGDGPNGKTITGFLYRYTKSEVSIMCVCHGNSFSPAGFVKHAGRTDTGNPLRHIIVVPSPVG